MENIFLQQIFSDRQADAMANLCVLGVYTAFKNEDSIFLVPDLKLAVT